MSIFIKNTSEIEKMRIACKIVANTHELIKKYIKVGISTKELDKIAEEYILSQSAVPSFKNYNGYPANICISINEEVIHGIPGSRKLIDGDVISVDIGAYINGFHGDAARTYGVGEITEENKRLIQVTEQCFYEGIKFAKENCHLNQISSAIGQFVENNGFSVVVDFVGHGVGSQLHESPQIPNFAGLSRGPRLRKGMTLAIEPMVNAGLKDVRVLSDKWTTITVDGKCSAHYENTVLITDGEPELLTI